MAVSLKKIALGLVSVGIVSVAQAGMYAPPPAAEPAQPSAKSGFYAGIGVGGISSSVEASGSGDIDDNFIAAQSNYSDGGNIAVNSGIFVGYGWAFPNRFHLGAEIFGNYTNAGASSGRSEFTSDIEDSFITFSGDTRLQYVYGIRALPGFQLTPEVVAYGIVGYARAHTKTTANESVVDVGEHTETFPSSTNSDDYNGYQLGLGSMIDVTEHIAVRGDLIYTGYQSKSNSYSSTFSEGSSSSELSTLEADVSLVYQFD